MKVVFVTEFSFFITIVKNSLKNPFSDSVRELLLRDHFLHPRVSQLKGMSLLHQSLIFTIFRTIVNVRNTRTRLSQNFEWWETNIDFISWFISLKGELTTTSDMEELENSLFLDQVPATWTHRAYPSLLGLGAWFADLLLRIRELETWSTDFVVKFLSLFYWTLKELIYFEVELRTRRLNWQLPTVVWLGGFFNPQSFLTAIMQNTARKNELPLDKMCLQCDVTKKQREEITWVSKMWYLQSKNFENWKKIVNFVFLVRPLAKEYTYMACTWRVQGGIRCREWSWSQIWKNCSLLCPLLTFGWACLQKYVV